RAEFVRVRRQRLREGGEELAERERRLLAAQRDAWMPCLKSFGDRAELRCTRELPDTVSLTWGDDDDLALLAGQEIIVLRLSGGDFTNAGLRHLMELSALEELVFDDTEVSDVEMRTVARLPHLRSLGLEGTLVTDAGLRHLRSARELVSLYDY